MPIYTLECPKCKELSEHIMGMRTEHALEVACPVCGDRLNRHDHRAYWADGIRISGDTCSGSVDCSNYFDEGLDSFVTSRTHRRELMKRKGLTEYAPDPDLAESRYIRKQAPNDPEAIKAAREVGRSVDKKRKERAVDANLSKFRDSLTK